MRENKPWLTYSDLTEDRLIAIANIIRETRATTVGLHDSDGGDSAWSLGCRAYSRTCHGIKKAANEYPWLLVAKTNDSLEFTFAIGEVPIRFYKGEPGNPPANYQKVSYDEIHHRQFALKLNIAPPIDTILRMAVETDHSGLAFQISLVELDVEGGVIDSYLIPEVSSKLATFRVPEKAAVELPPPHVELKSDNSKKANDASV